MTERLSDTTVVSHPLQAEYASKLARHLGAETGAINLGEHPDGQSFLRMESREQLDRISRRNLVAVLETNDERTAMQSFEMTAWLKRLWGRREVAGVFPSFGQARSDKEGDTTNYREAPLGFMRVDLFARFVDSMAAVDLHNADIKHSARSVPMKNVKTTPIFFDLVEQYLAENSLQPEQLAFISPDDGSAERMRKLNKMRETAGLRPIPILWGNKERHRNGSTTLKGINFEQVTDGDQDEQMQAVLHSLIADDIFATGGSVQKLLKKTRDDQLLPNLKRANIVATHVPALGVLAPDKFKRQAFESLRACFDMFPGQLIAGDTQPGQRQSDFLLPNVGMIKILDTAKRVAEELQNL